MSASPRLAVVVLNWNGRGDTLACLDSLVGEIGADDAVVVADNGSTDGSQDAIRARHPWAALVENGANLGFAGGNNAGLRWALARGFRWVMLLNNDTIVPRGTLAALLAHAEMRPAVGAFQPLLVDAADPSRVDSAGHQLFRRPGANDAAMGRPVAEIGTEPRRVFGACAAAALLRAQVLAEVGLLDEDMFVLVEDVDLMFRIRLEGFDVELVPSLRVLHRRGISANPRSGDAAMLREFWLRRNLLALGLRYWPARYLILHSPWIARSALRALRLAARLRGERCLPLWRRSLAMRRAARRKMRRVGLDVWFLPQRPAG